jgi:hypothetical protein
LFLFLFFQALLLQLLISRFFPPFCQRSKWGGGKNDDGAAAVEEEQEVQGMQRDAFDEPRGGLGGIGLGAAKQQQQYAGVDPEVAKNLKNLLPGNNKIFKMLEKMGFKNRLGKNEDGLATALAPTMLEAGSGLGYNQKNLQSAKEAKKKNESAKAAKTADGPVRREESSGWKKVCWLCWGFFLQRDLTYECSKGAKKAEVKYITAQERKEHATAAAGSSVIFDMRGPNARILQTEQVGQLASCDGSLHACMARGHPLWHLHHSPLRAAAQRSGATQRRPLPRARAQHVALWHLTIVLFCFVLFCFVSFCFVLFITVQGPHCRHGGSGGARFWRAGGARRRAARGGTGDRVVPLLLHCGVFDSIRAR